MLKKQMKGVPPEQPQPSQHQALARVGAVVALIVLVFVLAKYAKVITGPGSKPTEQASSTTASTEPELPDFGSREHYVKLSGEQQQLSYLLGNTSEAEQLAILTMASSTDPALVQQLGLVSSHYRQQREFLEKWKSAWYPNTDLPPYQSIMKTVNPKLQPTLVEQQRLLELLGNHQARVLAAKDISASGSRTELTAFAKDGIMGREAALMRSVAQALSALRSKSGPPDQLAVPEEATTTPEKLPLWRTRFWTQ
jgi:hypothetical protein